MKNSGFYGLPLFIAIFFLIGFTLTAQSQTESMSSEQYMFAKRIDTIVILDTETNIETVRIEESWFIKSIPSSCVPTLTVQGQQEAKLSIEQIGPNLNLSIQNADNCSDQWSIESYQLALLEDNRKISYMYNDKGGYYGSQSGDFFSKVKHGHTLKFQNILLVSKSGNMMAGKSLLFAVK